MVGWQEVIYFIELLNLIQNASVSRLIVDFSGLSNIEYLAYLLEIMCQWEENSSSVVACCQSGNALPVKVNLRLFPCPLSWPFSFHNPPGYTCNNPSRHGTIFLSRHNPWLQYSIKSFLTNMISDGQSSLPQHNYTILSAWQTHWQRQYCSNSISQ